MMPMIHVSLKFDNTKYMLSRIFLVITCVSDIINSIFSVTAL